MPPEPKNTPDYGDIKLKGEVGSQVNRDSEIYDQKGSYVKPGDRKESWREFFRSGWPLFRNVAGSQKGQSYSKQRSVPDRRNSKCKDTDLSADVHPWKVRNSMWLETRKASIDLWQIRPRREARVGWWKALSLCHFPSSALGRKSTGSGIRSSFHTSAALCRAFLASPSSQPPKQLSKVSKALDEEWIYKAIKIPGQCHLIVCVYVWI